MTLALLLLLALLGGGWLWTPDLPRAELEARYAGPGSEFVELMGLRLHVRDSAPQAGSERPVVLMLHGFGSSLHTWEAWATGLAATHRVIRIDLPGAGLTGADPNGDYSDERGIALLSALLTQRGVARATVLGHSMGGRLAWRYAAAEPARVDRLVLVAPDGFASPGFEYGKAPEVGVVAKAMQFALPKAVLRWSLAPAYADPDAVMSEALVTRYHALMLAPGVRPAIIARLQQLNLLPPPPLLRTIPAPTLLLWGEADRMIPVANAQDYLRDLPQARLVVLPGVGHVPHEEAPAAGLAAVQAFLAEAR
ncbi:alpha/beta fold hydrolase [Rubrivivax rivuli]|uniref:Alpha/beta fold hydrolase n=1 Tax=Rubrivivax rivuli TaxID=1862385 RepID=A0A437RCR3_9BURK|nr:alpha/beta fold hydrolase [Rubrivivax rivuli]RVU44514.1 alpha/beta fold hydrolase [Rubrivivax rivuli]